MYEEEDWWYDQPGFTVGTASISLYTRTVTKAERDRWKQEDEERDKRRIPLGFRAPETP